MTLSPTERREVVEAIKQASIAQAMEDNRRLRVVSLAEVQSILAGVSKATIRKRLPVVEITAQNHGVRLADLEAFIESRTQSFSSGVLNGGAGGGASRLRSSRPTLLQP